MLKQFRHVGIVVRDLDSATRRWVEDFGLVVVQSFVVPEEGVRSVMLAAPGDAGAPRVELLQPLDASDLQFAIARRLSTHGEGVFHLAFEVDASEAQRTANVKALDLVPLETTAQSHTWRSVLHPRSANGVLIEMLDSQPPSVD